MLQPNSFPIPLNPIDTNSRLGERLGRFMQDPSPFDARKRRECFAIELRSRARSDQLYKRRLEGEPRPSGTIEVSRGLAASKPVLEDPGASLEHKLTALKEVLAGNTSSLRADALKCLKGFSNVEQAHDIMCSNSTTLLLKDLLDSPHPQIVSECTSIFIGLTMGHTRVSTYLSRQGVVEALLKCISTHNMTATVNSLWALSNMLTDLPDVAITLMNKNILNTLQSVMEWYPPKEIEVWRAVCWCLSLVCSDRTSIIEAKLAVSLLKRLLAVDDPDIFTDAMSGIDRLVNGDQMQIKTVVDSTVIDWLIKGLTCQDNKARRHAIYAVTSITAVSVEQTQLLLVCNILDHFKLSIRSSDPRERISVLICLGNISYEASSMTSQMMSHNIMYDAVDTIMDSSDKIRDESLTFFESLSKNLTPDQRLKLIYVYDIFRPLRVALSMSHPDNLDRLVSLCYLLLDASEAEISRPSSENTVKGLFDSSGCLDEMSRIAVSAGEAIYREVFDLLDLFFNEAEEQDFDNPVPQGQFNFS
mmetsp:Transcript_32108/g.55400  ORF Transcript_32108/g.55400 Transcript_32108/m.55400 type:complete len:531 (-) Transcript_32108:1168-2760(-)